MGNTPDRKAFGAKPFWAWNGKLDRDELIRQIHVMKDMGFGGFFMHSRTGLETEYLGAEWFDLINACADEAEKLDMEAWLYDEDRWPSGSAGGIVTADERYRMKYLRMNLELKEVFEWRDDIISAFACDVDGINFTKALPISRHTDLLSLDITNIVYFTVEPMLCQPVYNGGTYLDTLSREATEAFLKSTHEQYVKHCKDRIGRSIPGIFTDEPYRGALMSGFSVPNRDRFNVCPYTDRLFEEFEKAYGYRLETKLPELFLRKDGNPYSPVKWQYTELVTTLFLENFARPYYRWCRENNMKVTGHVLHENDLTCQVSTMGSVMRYYPYMDIPGVDYLGEYGRDYCVVKQLASSCRQVGKTEMLSELLGCTGWHMTFDRYKHISDWQAIMGITLRCPHLSWYTMKGEAKRDYPASVLHQSSWHEAYAALEDYYTRISSITAKSERRCHTAVIMPVESVWAQIYAGWASDMSAVSPEVRKLEEIFRETYNRLLSAHVDFDYADESMMKDLGFVEDGKLRIGKALYDTVIVSGMVTMRKSTLDMLKAFREAGGTVIFAGDAPSLVDVLPSKEPALLAATCQQIALEDLSSLPGEPSINSRRIFVQTYTDGERNYYFCLNTDAQNDVKGVTVRFPETMPVLEYDLLTGDTYALAEETDKIVVDFCPGQLRVFMDCPLSLEPAKEIPETVFTERVYADEDFTLTAGEPNFFVMDSVSYEINEGELNGPVEVLKADDDIRRTLGLEPRGGSMLQPWFLKGGKDEAKGQVALYYKFRTDFLPDRPLYFMYEDAENVSSVTVNGVQIAGKAEPGVFLDSCFTRTDIAPYVQEGINCVCIKFGYRASSGVEATYLVGDFLADAKKGQISRTGGTPTFGSLTENGYPYYGGKLTYRLTFDRPLWEGEHAILHLNGYENAACFEADGRPIPFAPFTLDITDTLQLKKYCDVTVYLTRRNCFGPFYMKDKNPEIVHPGSFHAYETDSHVLLDSGLLERPYIDILKEV